MLLLFYSVQCVDYKIKVLFAFKLLCTLDQVILISLILNDMQLLYSPGSRQKRCNNWEFYKSIDDTSSPPDLYIITIQA